MVAKEEGWGMVENVMGNIVNNIVIHLHVDR